MKQSVIQKRLKSIKQTAHREALMAAGAYDGRFRQRSVEDKRFKKPKHKLKIFAE